MTTADHRARPAARHFRRLAVAVGVVSGLTFLWLITVGRPNLVPARDFGDVFDLQARALLDGRLSMPEGSLGFEGFLIDGKTYAYFGIFPSLIRLPVLLVTDHFDGRLTVVSMLAAYVIAYVSAVRVIDRSRALLRPGTAWSRAGLVAAGLLLVVVGLGSNLLFLGSAAWMYHEASLWGAAGVLASFAATLSFLERPRLRAIGAAGAWAAVAWLSRGSVGLAPSVVLGLLGLAHLSGARWLAALAPRPVGPHEEIDLDLGPAGAGATDPMASVAPARFARDPRRAAALLAAAAVGGLLFGAINTAKFGSPTRLPMDRQVASFNPWPERREALEVYDGSLFSARLIPSVLVQTFRPDLVEPSGTWPFVRQRPVEPPVWGDLVFDTVEPSSGLTVTSPLLLVLGGVGVVAALRPRRPGARGTSAAPLRPFLLGGVAATYAPLTIAFIAQRYLTDALPLLVVAAAGGVAVLDGWRPTPARSPRLRPVALGALAVLALFGTYVTLATSWSFQRFSVPPDGAARAAGLRTQLAVSDVLGTPPSATRYATLPDRAPEAGLAIRGACLGLYQGQPDGAWSPVEVSADGGRLVLRARIDRGSTVGSSALVAVGEADEHLVVTVEGSGDASRFRLVRDGVPSAVGPDVDLGGRDHRVEIQADPTLPWVTVYVDGEEAFFEGGRPPRRSTLAVGRDPFGEVPDFAGSVDELPTPTPTCDALVAAGG